MMMNEKYRVEDVRAAVALFSEMFDLCRKIGVSKKRAIRVSDELVCEVANIGLLKYMDYEMDDEDFLLEEEDKELDEMADFLKSIGDRVIEFLEKEKRFGKLHRVSLAFEKCCEGTDLTFDEFGKVMNDLEEFGKIEVIVGKKDTYIKLRS